MILENYLKTNVFKTLLLEIAFHLLIAYPHQNYNFKYSFQNKTLFYKLKVILI